MMQKETIEKFLKKNYLISPDFFEEYAPNDELSVTLDPENKPLILSKDLFFIFKKNKKVAEINWLEFEKSRALLEKGRDTKIYEHFLDILLYDLNTEKKKAIDHIVQDIKQPDPIILVEKDVIVPSIVVLDSFRGEVIQEKDVMSFVHHFKFRYDSLKDILMQRPELQNTLSISKLLTRKEKSSASLIGIIQDKRITQNGHVLLTLEDPTGFITVLINKERNSIFTLAKDLVLDDVIGVTGAGNGEIVFCENIFFPDVPVTKESKKCPDDVAASFISDIHVGSKQFMEKEFLRFISWLNLTIEKDIEIAKKIKYLFVLGDLVDGVGVYPGQYENLFIKDITAQYDKLAEYFSTIRKDINIILCPGDHDALRLAHPQPVLDKKFARKLWELKNITQVSNPSFVNIHSSQQFPGFNVLLYHGHGYHYYFDAVDSLKKLDTPHNPRHIMKFLLKRRHLAPTHTSTIYVPDHKEDPLVIKHVPDIFTSGHLHKSDVSFYNNICMINCSCWQSQTEFQVKEGNFPDPAKVPVLLLQRGEVEVLDFND